MYFYLEQTCLNAFNAESGSFADFSDSSSQDSDDNPFNNEPSSGGGSSSADSGADFNLVVLSGTIDDQPKIINTQNGTQGVAISLSVAKTIKDRMTGDMKSINSWYKLVSYNQAVFSTASKLSKGQKILVQGPLNIRSWQDQSGQKRTIYEISMEKVTVIGGGGSISSEADSNFDMQEDSVPF